MSSSVYKYDALKHLEQMGSLKIKDVFALSGKVVVVTGVSCIFSASNILTRL